MRPASKSLPNYYIILKNNKIRDYVSLWDSLGKNYNFIRLTTFTLASKLFGLQLEQENTFA